MALAAILAGLRGTGGRLDQQRLLFLGAGEAGTGTERGREGEGEGLLFLGAGEAGTGTEGGREGGRGCCSRVQRKQAQVRREGGGEREGERELL